MSPAQNIDNAFKKYPLLEAINTVLGSLSGWHTFPTALQGFLMHLALHSTNLIVSTP